MRELRDLLADEAERRAPTRVPPFEMLAARSAQRHRLRAAAAAVAVAAVVAAGFTGTPLPGRPDQPAATVQSAPSPVPLVTFDGGPVEFQHPASWLSLPEFTRGPGYYNLVTHLSTDELYACINSPPGQISCGAGPAKRLSPGGVSVRWATTRLDFPNIGPPPFVGQTRIDGYEATIDTGPANAACRYIGGAREIVASIKIDERRVMLNLDACLAEPGVAETERQVRAMLASVRINARK
jgi:hypothetical protein